MREESSECEDQRNYCKISDESSSCGCNEIKVQNKVFTRSVTWAGRCVSIDLKKKREYRKVDTGNVKQETRIPPVVQISRHQMIRPSPTLATTCL